MKHLRLQFTAFIVFIIITVITLYVARIQAPLHLQKHIYQQWDNHFVIKQGKQAYIKTNTDKDQAIVLSQSQGYGMLIAVDAAKIKGANQEDFDRLYRFYLEHRIQDTQLMSWKTTIYKNKQQMTTSSATDGDLNIAYALIKASQQWPSKSEEYKEQAKAILDDILKYNLNPETKVLNVGNWVGDDPSSIYYYVVRTSDTVPAYFEAFYKLTGDHIWKTIENNMLNALLQISNQTETGLLPDFMIVTPNDVSVSKPNSVDSVNDGNYGINANRTPYNLSKVDVPTSQKTVQKMLKFFNQQSMIKSGYTLNGNVILNYQTNSFNAPVFYAANKDTTYRRLIKDNTFIFKKPLPLNQYYDAALTTLIALEGLN